VLSYLFYCGLVVGGALLGIGQLARAIPRDRQVEEPTRALTVLVAAFAEGVGILAVVIGLGAVFIEEGGGMTAAALAVVPASILGVPAFMMLRPVGDQVTVRSMLVLLGAYMGGLAILLGVTVIQLLLQAGQEGASFDPLGGGLAVVGALSAAGIGYFGAHGVGSVSGGGQHVSEPTKVKAIRSRTLVRVAPLAAVGIGTAVLVMMQLFGTA
jgi:F0F1-type ATP synthase membrane subunit c/vacuolar-type H+-ATPase subunit K